MISCNELLECFFNVQVHTFLSPVTLMMKILHEDVDSKNSFPMPLFDSYPSNWYNHINSILVFSEMLYTRNVDWLNECINKLINIRPRVYLCWVNIVNATLLIYTVTVSDVNWSSQSFVRKFSDFINYIIFDLL